MKESRYFDCEIVSVLTVEHENPLHFDVDHSQILMKHEQLALAGPFITSVINIYFKDIENVDYSGNSTGSDQN